MLCARKVAKAFAFFGGVVNDQHTVYTGAAGVFYKGVFAVLQVIALHRVGIAHQHHGGGAVLLAEGAHHVQHFGGANAKAQSGFTGFLNDRTIGHRVAEGHAEFDDVSPCLDHAVHECRGDVGLRKTSHHIGNEGFAFFCAEFLEGGTDAAHIGARGATDVAARGEIYFTIVTGCSPPLTD